MTKWVFPQKEIDSKNKLKQFTILTNLKKTNSMITLTDSEKAFDKMQYPVLLKKN